MDIGLSEGAGAATALLGSGWFLKVLAERFVSKAQKAEDVAEDEKTKALRDMAAAVESMRSMLAEVKADMRLLSADLHHAKGEGSKTAERIDGISENHGERLGSLENRVTVLETTTKARAKR
jgi:signal transduction histidine kinase